jgi:aminocarboxymuconate-semialdehyde decarboxylase
MRSRRQFLKTMAGASAAAICTCGARGLLGAVPQQAGLAVPKHKPVMVAGKRIKTVDVHCHINVPDVASFLKGTPLEEAGVTALKGVGFGNPQFGDQRLASMDKEGIDVQAVSINAFWYGADRDLATRFIDFQNHKLAEMLLAAPKGRFVAFGSVALQFPDLAAKQLEDAMKMGLKGAAIGGSVPGEEVTSAKYDVFWAKAEELQAPIFMHPQDSANATGIANRVKGNGVLANVIGNPLETTIFLSHMIFEGVLEHHPGLKLCCAHGGGYLPSYADRSDHGCAVFPDQCKNSPLRKPPTEYLKQVYVDSLVFTPEALRHLLSVMGPEHIMLGTDYPFPWTENGAGTLGPVDHLFATPGLNDAQKINILGGTASKWLGVPT